MSLREPETKNTLVCTNHRLYQFIGLQAIQEEANDIVKGQGQMLYPYMGEITTLYF